MTVENSFRNLPRNFQPSKVSLAATVLLISFQTGALAQVPGVPSTYAAASSSFAPTGAPAPTAVSVPHAGGTNVVINGRIKTDTAVAEKLLSQGKWSEAEALFRDTLVNSPQDVGATLGLGLALANQFKLDAGDQLFDRILATDPNNAEAYAGKATVMLNRLQSSAGAIRDERDSILKQSAVFANRACVLGPANAQAHYIYGAVLKEQGQLDQAVSELNTATNFDPDLSYAYSTIGNIKLDRNSLAEATTNFRRAIALNSANSSAHYGLGATMLKQGDVNTAIGELNTSLYQFPNSWPVRMALGQAYQQQGNTVAALQQYQLSTLIKPENAGPYLAMAHIHKERGDLELAIADLRSGLPQSPMDIKLRERIADIDLELQRPEEAINGYRTVLQLSPSDNNAIKGLSQALFLKAQKETVGAMLQSNDYSAAKKALDEAVTLSPTDMELRLAKEKLLTLSGAVPDATKITVPTNDGDRFEYARALMGGGNFKAAEDQLNLVINNQTDPKQLFAVGDMALMIHALTPAETAYKKALSVSGAPDRGQRGLTQVTQQRQAALETLRIANELAKKKQWDGAISKYRAALVIQPTLADARFGLAEALEDGPEDDTFDTLTESAKQYSYYLALALNLSSHEKEKLTDLIEKLHSKADKMKQKDDKDKM
jgi:tetratricopeptide (TPR) repeat protein